MYCNYCRALNPDNAIYCSSCGRTIQPHIEKEKEQRETQRLETALQNLDVLQATEPGTEESSSWDYQKMSDEELEQLHASNQKLQQPINDPLRAELELRASRRPGAATIPSAPVVQVILTNQADPTGISPVVAVGAPAKQKLAHAPYARLMVQILSSCFFASGGVFVFFEARARNTTAFTILAFSILLTFAVASNARRTWQRILIVEPETDLKAMHRRQNILVAIADLVLLLSDL